MRHIISNSRSSLDRLEHNSNDVHACSSDALMLSHVIVSDEVVDHDITTCLAEHSLGGLPDRQTKPSQPMQLVYIRMYLALMWLFTTFSCRQLCVTVIPLLTATKSHWVTFRPVQQDFELQTTCQIPGSSVWQQCRC